MFDPQQVQTLAARRLTEQQIADVLGIPLQEIKDSPDIYSQYREAIRVGRSKGEAELRDGLYRRAKNGEVKAFLFLMRREQDHRD